MYRPAKKEDAAAVARLMFAAIGSIAHTLAGTDRDDEAIAVLEQFFRQEGNRVSYENVIVGEEEGRVIAFMLAYHGSEASRLDKPLLDRLEAKGADKPSFQREARLDEYYLDSLAVDPHDQGRGIGTELLRLFERQAAERGHRKMMLLVDRNNPSAKKLYDRMGYVADGTTTVSGHLFDRMIKQMPASSTR